MSLLRRPGAWAEPFRATGTLAVLMVVAVAAEHLYLAGTDYPRWAGWSAVAGVVGVAVSMGLLRRHPAVAAALVCALVGGTLVANDGWILVSYVVFAALVSFLVGRSADRVWPVVAVAGSAVVALTVLDPVVNGGGLRIAMVGNMVVFMALPWLSGRYLRQVARSHETEIEQVQLTERARLAQEMHDSLGHELSLIALRAGALEMAPGLSETHQRSAGAIRAAAAGATERLGEIVGVLRPASEAAPLAPSSVGIGGLVERARESGMDVRLEGSLDEHPANPPVRDAAAHRIVQEALTNAARHAPGSSVTVSVEQQPGGVRLAVTNGRATLPARVGATTRLGLVGLEEAARAAGGSLRHGPRPGGGFEVVADLPAAGVADDVSRHEATL
ncbi:sensor histidine kinase [Nocardioides albertanoniae]|uniref:sensor histidine kinase n=1 Tax=Nocardioides albertanoniae TaxID=1175486 RepID=UPI001476E4D6|nr:histidine kinase [Nocardioides albertanoniae]